MALNDDGAIRHNPDGNVRSPFQIGFEDVPSTVVTKPVQPTALASSWDDDDVALLVWAAQALFHEPLTLLASDVEGTDAEVRHDAGGDEVPYRGAAAIIDYLRGINADRATVAEAVYLDPDTPDDLLEAAAWSARADHTK